MIACLIILLPLSLATLGSAQTTTSPSAKLRYFGGALMSPPLADLTCSPVPCVLPNVNLSAGSLDSARTRLAVNPKNPQQLLAGAFDFTCNQNLTAFLTSNDGGSTWIFTCLNSLPGMFGHGNPGVGYDLHHNAYITGSECCDANNSDVIAFEKSTDNGKTWSAPQQAVPGLPVGGFLEEQWLQVDTNPKSPNANSLYISVRQRDFSGHERISVSHSRDAGSTWKTVAIDSQQRGLHNDDFSDMAIGEDGTIYLAWMRCTANGANNTCGGTKASFELSTSTDGGISWTKPKTIFTAELAPDTGGCYWGCLPNTNVLTTNIPAIAIDNSTGPHKGSLYVAFYTWTGTFMKVMVATSKDAGKTWNKKAVAPASDIHDQFFPWVSISRTGEVGVSWMDRRNDPNNLNYEAFAAFSGNGGASFGKNIDLSATPSNPLNNGSGGFFNTDYTVNAWASKNTFYVNYTDTSIGLDQDFLAGYIR
jgi:hypothetical protein